MGLKLAVSVVVLEIGVGLQSPGLVSDSEELFNSFFMFLVLDSTDSGFLIKTAQDSTNATMTL